LSLDFVKIFNLHNIKFAQYIDGALGGSNERNVSFGQLFVAMLLNGLGFTGRTLHM
jgi:hypothetical protein